MDQQRLKLRLEAERRGILPPDKVAMLNQLRERGLISETPPSQTEPGVTEANGPDAPIQYIPSPGEMGMITDPRIHPSPWSLNFVPDGAIEPPPQQNSTAYGLYERGMSGVNEGQAHLAGAPVDLTTAALNAGARGVNNLFGTNLQPIENPVGGSGTFKNLMDPFIVDRGPSTTAEKYARRIGTEIGFGVPIALGTAAVPGAGAAARANLPAYLGVSTTSDVRAGAGGQLDGSTTQRTPNGQSRDRDGRDGSRCHPRDDVGGWWEYRQRTPPEPAPVARQRDDSSQQGHEARLHTG